MHSSVYAAVRRLSVRLSITRVYCVEITELVLKDVSTEKNEVRKKHQDLDGADILVVTSVKNILK